MPKLPAQKGLKARMKPEEKPDGYAVQACPAGGGRSVWVISAGVMSVHKRTIYTAIDEAEEARIIDLIQQLDD